MAADNRKMVKIGNIYASKQQLTSGKQQLTAKKPTMNISITATIKIKPKNILSR